MSTGVSNRNKGATPKAAAAVTAELETEIRLAPEANETRKLAANKAGAARRIAGDSSIEAGKTGVIKKIAVANNTGVANRIGATTKTDAASNSGEMRRIGGMRSAATASRTRVKNRTGATRKIGAANSIAVNRKIGAEASRTGETKMKTTASNRKANAAAGGLTPNKTKTKAPAFGSVRAKASGAPSLTTMKKGSSLHAAADIMSSRAMNRIKAGGARRLSRKTAGVHPKASGNTKTISGRTAVREAMLVTPVIEARNRTMTRKILIPLAANAKPLLAEDVSAEANIN
jgi:hypothetical protein